MKRAVRGITIGFLSMVMLVLVSIGWPIRFDVPGSFVGGAQVRLDDPGCPRIGRDGWFYVIVLDERGTGCVNGFDLGGKWRVYRYEAICSDGSRRRYRFSSTRGDGIVTEEGGGRGVDGVRAFSFTVGRSGCP
ncbi:MAG: hypothetical protein U0821_00830 [Chloroflexota bacterium]